MSNPTAGTFLEHLFNPDWDLPSPTAHAEAASEIARIYAATGGATFSLYFGDQSGQPLYAVGLNNDITRFPTALLALADGKTPTEESRQAVLTRVIHRFIVKYRSLLANPRCCVGIWAGPDEAGATRLFLDIAVLIYHEDTALAFGREGNQIAIFSLRDGSVIDVGGTGEPTEARLTRLAQQDRPIRLGGIIDE